MKVSVLILIHDEEINTEKCVYSIINQTYKNFEIVVIDDSNKEDLVVFLKN